MPTASPPDPRPVVRPTESGPVLRGYRCSRCGHAVAVPVAWCPLCRAPVEARDFGPLATVWASTVMRIAIGHRRPPYTLAYVDVDEGPRLLVHLDREPPGPVPAGTRVRLVGYSAGGDLLAAETSAADRGPQPVG